MKPVLPQLETNHAEAHARQQHFAKTTMRYGDVTAKSPIMTDYTSIADLVTRSAQCSNYRVSTFTISESGAVIDHFGLRNAMVPMEGGGVRLRLSISH